MSEGVVNCHDDWLRLSYLVALAEFTFPDYSALADLARSKVVGDRLYGGVPYLESAMTDRG
jgi:hypothetical protein